MYAYINMWVCVSSPQQSQLSQSSHTSYYSLAGAKEWGHASMPRKPLLFKRIVLSARAFSSQTPVLYRVRALLNSPER